MNAEQPHERNQKDDHEVTFLASAQPDLLDALHRPRAGSASEKLSSLRSLLI